ncbi:helix-turn-helix domain-containing protein [Bradyrhizobium sp. 23AC]
MEGHHSPGGIVFPCPRRRPARRSVRHAAAYRKRADPAERQCLAWTAQGKTVADIAVLVEIAPRTVVFHLENARRKLGAASIAQCVAIALRRGLLS